MQNEHYTTSSIQEVLAELLASKRRTNSRFSLRLLSRQLGYKNPSLLHDVMNGRRPASLELINRVAFYAKIPASEFQELCQQTSLKTKRPTKILGATRVNLSLDEFKLISDWYHFALIELLKIEKKMTTARELAVRLLPPIPVSTARLALKRLSALDLVQELDGGCYALTKNSYDIFAGRTVSSEAIRNHHRQMLELASAALEEHAFENRDFSGTTIALRDEDIPLVTEEIYKFHRWLTALSVKQKAHDRVCRLNIQFFNLSQRRE